MKRLFLIAISALAIIAGCSKNPSDGPSADPTSDTPGGASVKVEIRVEGSGAQFASEISHSIRVREFSQLEVRLTPEDSPAKITWETDNIDIARVSRNGTLTGRGEGTVDIHVLADGKKAAVCHLTVTEYEAVVESFQLDVSEVELAWSETARVVVKRITPSGISIGDVSFEFSSSDVSNFTVDNDSDGFGCKIYGVDVGSAVLHAEVREAQLDIPVTVTKKHVGLEAWRYDTPYDDFNVPHEFQQRKLNVFYPTYIDVYIWDEVSLSRVDDRNNGQYKVVNHNKETVNAAAWEDCISVVARGDGSSDDEGWGSISLYFENDWIVSEVEDLQIEFRGCNALHGDMTLKSNNPNEENPEEDLCGKLIPVVRGGYGKFRIGRKSNQEIKGVYRFNRDRDWLNMTYYNFELKRYDMDGGIVTFWGILGNTNTDTNAANITIESLRYNGGYYGDVKRLELNFKIK